MMQQAADFGEEVEALHALVSKLSSNDFERPSAFKSWTTNDVLVHLHYWNIAADASLTDPDRLMQMVSGVMSAPSMRAHENAEIAERGPELLSAWHELATDMAKRWSNLDPKMRVKWAGPDMSVRSSMTARQMEHWAHGQELFDLFGVERQNTDRIRNIVVLGVNTFGWTFKLRGEEPPGDMPSLSLTAPSGAVWTYGDSTTDCIEGSAVEFCQVVTQTRNIADTKLRVSGPVAESWMAKAQCFAGKPETPPEPGTRRIEAVTTQ